jgi:hypothetical protein
LDPAIYQGGEGEGREERKKRKETTREKDLPSPRSCNVDLVLMYGQEDVVEVLLEVIRPLQIPKRGV